MSNLANVRLSSTTSDRDRADHPYIYATVNTILWLIMLFMVALPFGIVSSLLVVFIRPLTVVFPESDIYDLADLLELCQFMPELCIINLLTCGDFLRAVDECSRAMNKNTVFWLLFLLFIAWPIAYVCANLYVLVSPAHALIPDLNCLVDLLKVGMNLPYKATKNAANGADIRSQEI